jgi:predicted alpha/beta hydrolase
MATRAPATELRRDNWTRAVSLQGVLFPLASLLVALSLVGAGPRLLIIVALPALAIGAISHRLSRPSTSGVALLLGVLALSAGLIARSNLLFAAGVLYLLAGISRGWGVNRGRRRRRAWANRLLAIVGAALVGFFVVFPTLLAVDFLAKPRAAINQAALGLPHERVAFSASDGVHLAGWYVPSGNGAAVVLVHGGGGDRQGTILQARMLAKAGYGVLLYDARGRGESAGHENAAGWQWDRDVRGAVSFLTSAGIDHIGLLGLSTGAEAVVTEAASDKRVEAVVADGLQARTAADASHASFGDRISIEPGFAVAGLEIRLARGETQPRPLIDVVHEVARTRPLLLIATIAFEREIDHVYTRGTKAQLWELPTSAHTKGLQDHPITYAQRVLSVFNQALLRSHRGK